MLCNKGTSIEIFLHFFKVPNKFCSIKMTRNQFKEKEESFTMSHCSVCSENFRKNKQFPQSCIFLTAQSLVSSLGLCT